MRKAEKDEKEELLKLLNKLKEENILVIVEGSKDKRALKCFGIKNVFVLYRKPMYKFVEIVVKILHKNEEKEVVLLVDLDKEGKKLYSMLNHEFCQRGVRVNNKLRDFLFKKTKLRQIEGLDRYMEEYMDMMDYTI